MKYKVSDIAKAVKNDVGCDDVVMSHEDYEVRFACQGADEAEELARLINDCSWVSIKGA
jgi:hypothetical protein